MSYRGKRAFERCDVKVIETKCFVYVSGVSGQQVQTTTPSEDTRLGAGYSAVLHCPRTEDDRVMAESQFTSHASPVAAYKSLGKIAGEMLCSTCIYSNMTPVEVANQRAKQVRAEADLIDAQALRAKAIQELIAVDPAYKDAY